VWNAAVEMRGHWV